MRNFLEQNPRTLAQVEGLQCERFLEALLYNFGDKVNKKRSVEAY